MTCHANKDRTPVIVALTLLKVSSSRTSPIFLPYCAFEYIGAVINLKNQGLWRLISSELLLVLRTGTMAARAASTCLLCATPPNPRLHSVLLNTRPLLGLSGRFHGPPIRLIAVKAGKLRFGRLPFRAATSDETPNDTSKQLDKVLLDLNEKWDSIENKSTVFIYGGGALAALWLSSTVVGAINSLPLLPKVMELIGLVYTVWFAYRYLLFKESRQELAADIEELKRKITGSEDD